MNPKQRKKAKKIKLEKRYNKGAITKSEMTNWIVGMVKYKIKNNGEIGSKYWRMWIRDKNTGKILKEKVFEHRLNKLGSL